MGEIDYVVPMVFPDDETWQQGFMRVGTSYRRRHVRWRSWGTERQLVRLVKKNMPFIRDIIILLACKTQKQPWMDEEGVRVVYHKDFIPQKFLPTFNSCTIEMFLHNIPHLSEWFIYGNDDMYPLSPLTEDDFFYDGLPCIHMTVKEYPQTPNTFQRSCMNGLNFVARDFRCPYTNTWLKNGHSLAPIVKATCEKLWRTGRSDIEYSITPMRDAKNFNQYIYTWWQYLAKQYVDFAPKRRYMSVKEDEPEDMVEAIGQKDAGILCINDNECGDDFLIFSEAVRDALNKKIEGL